ncbi:Insulin growth factor-like family member 1 [Heterocephalus glaber]|uniref:Insulin growth factor-like family member 1 n=1 Tax=Heterocephalus glaber TaxID=10181 RepID=G5AUY9_HETGA|nr:Insulin growth factor-like family member 1 [Heterocephalus glaber]
MPACCRILAFRAAVCLLSLLCTRAVPGEPRREEDPRGPQRTPGRDPPAPAAWGTGALSPPLPPTGTTVPLCQAHLKCGDQFYHPLQHCCLNGALVLVARTRLPLQSLL